MNAIKSHEELSISIANKPWLLLYFSAGWCQPCISFSPVIAQVSEALSQHEVFSKHIDVLKIDVDTLPEVAGQHEIRSIPTLILLHEGKEVARNSGSQPLNTVTDWLQSHIKL